MPFALRASPEEIVALSTGAFAQDRIEKSREALLDTYLGVMEWDIPQESYKLFLFSLLANFSNLVRRDKSDVGDVAMVIATFGSCAELWYDDIPLRDFYNQRALTLAARSHQLLHYHLIPTLKESPRLALQWQPRFHDKIGRAYLTLFYRRKNRQRGS